MESLLRSGSLSYSSDRLLEETKAKTKDLLSCSLCFQRYRDARTLPCSHAFCLRCLQNLLDSLQASSPSVKLGSFTCPTCQTRIGVPLSGVKEFPVDNRVDKIMDQAVNEMMQKISRSIRNKNNSTVIDSDSADYIDVDIVTDQTSSNGDAYSDRNRSNFYQSKDGFLNGTNSSPHLTGLTSRLIGNSPRYSSVRELRSTGTGLNRSSSFNIGQSLNQARNSASRDEPLQTFKYDLNDDLVDRVAPIIGRNRTGYTSLRDRRRRLETEDRSSAFSSRKDQEPTRRTDAGDRYHGEDGHSVCDRDSQFCNGGIHFEARKNYDENSGEKSQNISNGINQSRPSGIGVRKRSSILNSDIYENPADQNGSFKESLLRERNFLLRSERLRGQCGGIYPEGRKDSGETKREGGEFGSMGSSNTAHLIRKERSKLMNSEYSQDASRNLGSASDLTSCPGKQQLSDGSNCVQRDQDSLQKAGDQNEPCSDNSMTFMDSTIQQSNNSMLNSNANVLEQNSEAIFETKTADEEFINENLNGMGASDVAVDAFDENIFNDNFADNNNFSRQNFSRMKVRKSTSRKRIPPSPLINSGNIHRSEEQEDNRDRTQIGPILDGDLNGSPDTTQTNSPGYSKAENKMQQMCEASEAKCTGVQLECRTDTASNIQDNSVSVNEINNAMVYNVKDTTEQEQRHHLNVIDEISRDAQNDVASNSSDNQSMRAPVTANEWRAFDSSQQCLENLDLEYCQTLDTTECLLFSVEPCTTLPMQVDRGDQADTMVPTGQIENSTAAIDALINNFFEDCFNADDDSICYVDAEDGLSDVVQESNSVEQSTVDILHSDADVPIFCALPEDSCIPTENVSRLTNSANPDNDYCAADNSSSKPEQDNSGGNHEEDDLTDNVPLTDQNSASDSFQKPLENSNVRQSNSDLRSNQSKSTTFKRRISFRINRKTSETTNGVKDNPMPNEGTATLNKVSREEYVLPSSIAMLSKGTTVVADYGIGSLKFIFIDEAECHKIDNIKPFSIAINPKNENVIVGDRKNRTVCMFDEFGSDVAQWNSNMFNWICGIGVLKNGNLVILDRAKSAIGIYSSGGELIREFGSYGSGDSQLCMGEFLAVDSMDRIITCDSGNHCVKVFSTEGKILGMIGGGRGNENDDELEWPKGVCVDSRDNIIVADSCNNRVSMFAPSGEFVQHLVTNIRSPYAVCYRHPSDVAVTSYNVRGSSDYSVYTVP